MLHYNNEDMLNHADIEEALNLAQAYIDYVKWADITLHEEADGEPSVENKVQNALKQIREANI